MSKNKSSLLGMAGFLVLAGILGYAVTKLYAANYLHRLTTGANNQKWLIDTDGSTMQAGPEKFGNSATVADITLVSSTTGHNFSQWMPVYNPSTSTISQGTILVASTTGLGYIDAATANTDLTTIIGVAAESISATSNGWMIPRGGGYALVLTTGTVAIGDTLVSTISAAGRLTGDATPTSGADVAIALEVGTATGDTIIAIMK